MPRDGGDGSITMRCEYSLLVKGGGTAPPANYPQLPTESWSPPRVGGGREGGETMAGPLTTFGGESEGRPGGGSER